MATKIEVLTQATIEKGGVLAMLYFDMHGSDKEKLENLLVDLANRLNGEKGVVYSVGEIDRAIQFGDKYSAAAKVTVLTSSFSVLSRICDNFGPIGIEILKPNEIHLSIPDAQQVLFDHVKMMSDLLREMIEKTMTPEERKKLGKLMEARAELGKDLLKKGDSAPIPKKDGKK
ncbi:Uncharacterised protein [uncultured archaeon]|nr:Uncharacterised protein [uncultured archaeon]